MKHVFISLLLTLLSSLHAADRPATSEARHPSAAAPHGRLLLDSRVVLKTQNARLELGTITKHAANPLMAEDKPWEVRFDNLYANVIRDPVDSLYKCWYSPFIVDASSKGMSIEQRNSTRYRPPPGREMAVCYAVSQDGLKWEKPELGLVDFGGSMANNILLRGPHGAGVTYDGADPNAQRRFKMFRAEDMRYSADGIHWSEAVSSDGTGARSDTHNNMLRVPEQDRFAGFVRLFDKTDGIRQRVVGRTESSDLKHWTHAVEVLRCDPQNQAYAMPVFRHADVYLGLLAVFRVQEDRVHTELAWSPDSVTWHRIQSGTPLIANSPHEGDYDWGCVYAAASPVVLDHEIRIYYGGSNGRHTSWRDGFLCLAALRPDGWAGYVQEKADVPAVVTTHPVTCTGARLWITADVNPGGRVKISAMDESGQAADTFVISETGTRTQAGSLAKFQNHPVTLRFEITNAKVYSFGFADPF